MVAVLLCVAFVRSASAAGDKHERASLKGINQLSVLVAHFDSEGQAAGISKDELKTAVELRLRQSHIKVSEPESGDPYLGISILVIKLPGREGFVYSINLGLEQVVTLTRNNALSIGETWSTAGMGASPAGEFEESVQKLLAGEVDRFINDYLAANQ